MLLDVSKIAALVWHAKGLKAAYADILAGAGWIGA
jgi:hypothetical protein